MINLDRNFGVDQNFRLQLSDQLQNRAFLIVNLTNFKSPDHDFYDTSQVSECISTSDDSGSPFVPSQWQWRCCVARRRKSFGLQIGWVGRLASPRWGWSSKSQGHLFAWLWKCSQLGTFFAIWIQINELLICTRRTSNMLSTVHGKEFWRQKEVMVKNFDRGKEIMVMNFDGKRKLTTL